MESPLPNAESEGRGRIFLALAGGYGVLAVGFGAYRAHGLPQALKTSGVDPAEIAERVSNLGIAVQYTLLHAVAIIGVLALREIRFRQIPCFAFSCGILLFSGSLTLDAVWAYRAPPFVPPIGGMLLISGWLSLIAVAWIRPRAKQAANC